MLYECLQNQDPFKDISSFGNTKKSGQRKTLDIPLFFLGLLAKNHLTQGAVWVLTVSDVPVIGIFEKYTSNSAFYQKATE